MKNKINYAEKFLYEIENGNAEMTMDNFFNKYGVKKEDRSNFLVDCILKQADEIKKKREDKNYVAPIRTHPVIEALKTVTERIKNVRDKTLTKIEKTF